jgi:hypothetical protein
MGIIFLCMSPLLFLLRNARDLHPHTPTITRRPQPVAARQEELEPEPELVGALD